VSVKLTKNGGKIRVEDPDRQEAAQLIAAAPPALRDRLTAAFAGVLSRKPTMNQGKQGAH
jgi:hypothetical protein